MAKRDMMPVMMEQIAMYMTSLPCPPLPVKVLDGGTEQMKVCSSHDLLAGLLISAMVRGNGVLNEQRKQKQMAITKKLVDQCMASNNNINMYDVCKEFTAEYIHAFDDAGTCTAAVQFLSMDEVVKGDKVHTATASWHAAQDILHCPVGQQRKAVQFAKMSYDQLIQLHWLRVRDEPTTTLVVVEADNAEK